MADPLFGDPEHIVPLVEKWKAARPFGRIQWVLPVGQDSAAISPAFEFPVLKCSADGHLRVARAENSTVTFAKVTDHSVEDGQQLDVGFLGANRDDLTIFNHSRDWLYIKLGFPPVSTSSYTTVVMPFSEWRLSQSNPLYGGPVFGIWASPVVSPPGDPGPPGGHAVCTELT